MIELENSRDFYELKVKQFIVGKSQCANNKSIVTNNKYALYCRIEEREKTEM